MDILDMLMGGKLSGATSSVDSPGPSRPNPFMSLMGAIQGQDIGRQRQGTILGLLQDLGVVGTSHGPSGMPDVSMPPTAPMTPDGGPQTAQPTVRKPQVQKAALSNVKVPDEPMGPTGTPAKPFSKNLIDTMPEKDILGIQVEDIPPGMSPEEFLKQKKSLGPQSMTAPPSIDPQHFEAIRVGLTNTLFNVDPIRAQVRMDAATQAPMPDSGNPDAYRTARDNPSVIGAKRATEKDYDANAQAGWSSPQGKEALQRQRGRQEMNSLAESRRKAQWSI